MPRRRSGAGGEQNLLLQDTAPPMPPSPEPPDDELGWPSEASVAHRFATLEKLGIGPDGFSRKPPVREMRDGAYNDSMNAGPKLVRRPARKASPSRKMA